MWNKSYQCLSGLIKKKFTKNILGLIWSGKLTKALPFAQGKKKGSFYQNTVKAGKANNIGDDSFKLFVHIAGI